MKIYIVLFFLILPACSEYQENKEKIKMNIESCFDYTRSYDKTLKIIEKIEQALISGNNIKHIVSNEVEKISKETIRLEECFNKNTQYIKIINEYSLFDICYISRLQSLESFILFLLKEDTLFELDAKFMDSIKHRINQCGITAKIIKEK